MDKDAGVRGLVALSAFTSLFLPFLSSGGATVHREAELGSSGTLAPSATDGLAWAAKARVPLDAAANRCLCACGSGPGGRRSSALAERVHSQQGPTLAGDRWRSPSPCAHRWGLPGPSGPGNRLSGDPIHSLLWRRSERRLMHRHRRPRQQPEAQLVSLRAPARAAPTATGVLARGLIACSRRSGCRRSDVCRGLIACSHSSGCRRSNVPHFVHIHGAAARDPSTAVGRCGWALVKAIKP